MTESSAVPESPSRLGEGEEAADSAEDQHGGSIDEPDAPAAPEDADHPEPDDAQEENAETSLDQPST